MRRESPFSGYRFVRELQYAWAYHFLSIQYAILGNSGTAIQVNIEKGILSSLKNTFGSIRERFFGKLVEEPKFDGEFIDVFYDPDEDYSYLKDYGRKSKVLEFPEGTIRRKDLDDNDKAIFDFLNKDWNSVYEDTRDKATLLGYIAEFMIGKGEDPEEISQMSIPKISNVLESKYSYPGLDQLDELQKQTGLTRDRLYPLIYANSKGAEWLAIYDENGERKGKAYDLITKMYRQQIAEALARNAKIEDIRGIMVSPDDDEIKHALGLFDDSLSESEKLQREADYEDLVRMHLNRDMQRFAYTEVMINMNQGRLMQMLDESDGKPQYVSFHRIF
jgi:hypothetical protein